MGLLGRLREGVDAQLLLRAQRERIAALEAEVVKRRQERDRVRAAARRCLTCDYRLQALGKRADDGSVGP